MNLASESLADFTATTPASQSSICNVQKDGNIYPDPFGLNIGNSFAGIPQNVVINLIIFAILLTVFVSLRKRRWGSSKIPLVGRRKNDWSSIFYGNRALEEQFSRSFASACDESSPGISPESEGIDVKMIRVENCPAADALSFSSWFKNAFLARDEFLLDRSGPAAIEYMRFQRHVIAFTAILCVISIAIILPVNYRGNLQSNLDTSFPKTTIGNVDSQSGLLWVHVAFTVILFPMGLLVMLSYGLKFRPMKAGHKVPKTLMFYGLHPELASEEKIRKHFREAYPDIQVTAVNFTTDVAKLNDLDEELETVKQALTYCENTMKDQPDRLLVLDSSCGTCCTCLSCCGKSVDAVEFYQNKKAELERKILDQLNGWKKTNSVFFVSFATPEMAAQVYKDYRRTRVVRTLPHSTLSGTIKASHWRARFAPSAPFVSWENLSLTGLRWWARAITINIVFFLFLFFISTPAVALNYITVTFNGTSENAFIKSLPFVSQFLPSILLLAVSGLIPVFIYYTVRWTGYHTRSKEQRAEMKLLFGFLLIAILIFPTLSLTSLNVVVESLFQGEELKWECAFLPDNGAIFVNLMVATAFVGSASQLLRVGQLLVFSIRFWCCARSEAEKYIILKTKAEFPFYENYPDFLLNFAIVAVYCFICPIVTPFGLLALTMKHFVDRYNLSYVYKRSSAPNCVHASAINFFLVAIIMQNFLMLFFFLIRTSMSAEGAILIALLIINLLIYVGISWFGLLRKVSLYDEFNEDDVDTPLPSPVSTPVRKSRNTYIAPVLQKFDTRQMINMENVTGATVSG